MYPKLYLNKTLLLQNIRRIIKMNNDCGIHTTVVTKCLSSWEPFVRLCIEGGATAIGDSRILNFKRLAHLEVEKWLLRIPAISEAEQVVQYATVSLNSELAVLTALSEAAQKQNKTHKAIIMVELGDLREGIMAGDLEGFLEQALKLPSLEIIGLGTNHNCYGGVIPDVAKMTELAELAKAMRERFGIALPVVSGGNSGAIYLAAKDEMPQGITNLRIGEGILLGHDCSYGTRLEGTTEDAFLLVGEVIECKEKPSQSWGQIGLDAFGEPVSPREDKGIIKRAIVNIGRMDIHNQNLRPVNKDIEILGASSDHLLLDITNAQENIKIGDKISFYPNYGCLLAAFLSPHVEKEIIEA